jgi:hypothetical protein
MRAKKITAALLGILILAASDLLAQQATAIRTKILVIGVNGIPVAHARIRVLPSTDTALSMETDDKGWASLDLRPRKYAVFVSYEGFKPVAISYEVQSRKDPHSFAIELTPLPQFEKDTLLVLAPLFDDPWKLRTEEFRALPHTAIKIHDAHTNADESYSGVRLADLLARMGVPLGSHLRGQALTDYIVATGSDGYLVVLALAEVDPSFHPGEVLVADSMDGRPLDAHSGPFKLVVTEDKRPARSVRNLVSIELKEAN